MLLKTLAVSSDLGASGFSNHSGQHFDLLPGFFFDHFDECADVHGNGVKIIAQQDSSQRLFLSSLDARRGIESHILHIAMAPQAIRELLHASPFAPFKVRLPDGRQIPVPTPDHASLSPAGRRLVIFSDEDQMNILDPILIPALELETPKP